jgi:hypothetical protein
MLELLPGESYVVRLSRVVGHDYYNTGTGTAPASTVIQFRVPEELSDLTTILIKAECWDA